MKLLAFDTSTKATGVAIFDSAQYIKSGAVFVKVVVSEVIE